MGGDFSSVIPMSGFLKSGQLITGQTGLIYKGKDGTGRIIKPDEYQPKGSYATANHNHNGVYATVAQYNELKTSVSNGKSLIASAITDKGVSTASDATFQTMSNNIRNIETNIYSGIKIVDLPDGYTQKNYIELSEGCCINTEYILPQLYYRSLRSDPGYPRYEFGYTMNIPENTGADKNLSQCILGRYSSNEFIGIEDLGYFQEYAETNYVRNVDAYLLYGGYKYNTITNVKYTLNRFTTNRGTRFSSYIIIWINDYNINDGIMTTGSDQGGPKYLSSNITVPITIGSHYRSGAVTKYYPYKLRCYGFYSKVEDTDTYYANMIPCTNPSGVPGFYDTIRNLFVTGNGIGTITAG